MMAENVMFQEAIDAVRQGQRHRAHDLLTRLLRADQSNPEYWLWMSSVVDTVKERTYCLQMVLRLDPGNATASQGLVLLGVTPAAMTLAPVPPVRRKWNVPLQDVPKKRGLRVIWENPVLRGVFFVILTILLVGLISGGIFGYRTSRAIGNAARRPTKTPGPPPTFTVTPTFIPSGRTTPTPIPRARGSYPLAILLGVSYTSTPVYVNTLTRSSKHIASGSGRWRRETWRLRCSPCSKPGRWIRGRQISSTSSEKSTSNPETAKTR